MNKTNDLQLQNASDISYPSPSDNQVGESRRRRGICDDKGGGTSQEGGQDPQEEEVPDQGGDGEPPDQGSKEESKTMSPLAYFCQGEKESLYYPSQTRSSCHC